MTDALVMATHKQHEDVLRYVISQGAAINDFGQIKSNEWWTALDVAAHKGNQHFVETLLALGAQADLSGGAYGTALIAAIDSDHCNHSVVEIILAAGVEINETVVPAKASRQGCALNAAIKRADLQAMKILLDHGADPNVVNGRENTSLMLAVSLRNEAIMDMLMEKGADVNLNIDPPSNLWEDSGTVSALEVAAKYGHTIIIERLVKDGAVLVQPNDDAPFKTALQCAAYYGMPEAIKTLLRLGSDATIVGGFCGSALQAAATSGSLECITLLLDAGADINQHHIGRVCTYFKLSSVN